MSDSSSAAHQFVRLVDLMATLRGPGGCPWDRAQTIDTLKPFVLEETYEVLEAIDRQDHAELCEELGDFMFEAVFLAQLESEAGHFTLADALRSVVEKLVRRHPHVFEPAGGKRVESPGQVRAQWEEIKALEGKEGKAGTTLLGGIARTLPALLRAFHIGSRAASVGFDWTAAEDVVEKMREEVDELREVVARDRPIDPGRAEEEMGDLLFAIANLSRKLGVEPESALRRANEKFTGRFTAMERAIGDSGRAIREMSADELDREWRAAKGSE